MGKILSAEERQELLDEHRLEEGRRYADRIKAILLLDDGYTYCEISRVFFLDEGSIRSYLKSNKFKPTLVGKETISMVH